MRPRFPILLMGGNAGDQSGAGGSGGGTNTGGASSPGSGGGTAAPADWRGGLSGEFETLRGEATLANFKGKDFSEVAPHLAKALVHNQRLLGDSIRIPKPGADGKIDPKAQREFHTKLGVPESVEGYKDVKLPDVPGRTWDTQSIDAMAKPAFLKMGLNPQQAQDALTLFAEYTARQEKTLIDGFLAGQDSLIDKWGLAFDGNTNLAYRTLEKFFPQPFIKMLTAAGLDAHPDFIQGFYNIGRNFAGDSILDGSQIGAPTMEDLDKQITEMRTKIATLPQGSQARTDLEKKLEDVYKARYPEPASGRR